MHLRILVLIFLGATTAFGQESREWRGTWNNRRFGTSGPLTCQATQTAPGRWQAVFSGSFQGDPFQYPANFQSNARDQSAKLTGTSTIRGDRYQWNGVLQGSQLQGEFQSRSGNRGTFTLGEIGGGSSSTLPPGPSETAGPDSFEAIIRDGERMLFIGNSLMGNEGGVQNYLAKALSKKNIAIKTNALIYDGLPLDKMLIPEVGKALNLDRFDSVVITSGPLDTMRTFDKRIQDTGKKTMVFMTWTSDHPGNGVALAKYTRATKRDEAIMRRFEKRTGAVIVPVAIVFHELTLRPPSGVPREAFLWHSGNEHQNELGTMVAAWTLYSTLTGQSPVGINFDMPPYVTGRNLQSDPALSLTPELRRELQYRVWDVVRAWKTGKSHLK